MQHLSEGQTSINQRLLVDSQTYFSQNKRIVACFFLLLVFLSPLNNCWAKELLPLKFTFSIKNLKIVENDRTIRVQQGKNIELEWTTDKELELHLHGYDILFEISPNEKYRLKFLAHTAGRFPVSAHQKNGGKHHHRPLIYIEIHPK